MVSGVSFKECQTSLEVIKSTHPRLQQTVFVAVDKTGVKGDGQIITVLSVFHMAGVQCVAVAESGFSFGKGIFLSLT